MKKIVFLFFFLFPFIKSNAQQYNFTNYNTTSGLIGNEVHGIFQDPDGAMYITTTSGISIFDGYRFKNFGFKDGLTYDYIKNMGVLNNKELLFFANTGREAYIFRNQNFVRKIKTPNIITQHLKGKKNEDLVCTDIGLFEYAADSFIKRKITPDTSVPANAFYKFQYINDSLAIALRVFPKNQLDLVNTKTKKIVYSINNFFGFQVFIDSKKRIWICSDTWGPVLLNKAALHPPYDQVFSNQPVSLEGLMGTQVCNAVEDKKGNIWFATTGKGVAKFLPDGTCEYLTTENGLLSNYVFKVFTDAEDNLWIGSQKGLQLLTDYNTKLYDKRIGMKSDAVNDAVQTDSVSILAATERSVSIINTITNKATFYELPVPAEGPIIKFFPKEKVIYAFTSARILEINLSAKQIFTHASSPTTDRLMHLAFTMNNLIIALTTKNVYQYKNGAFIPLISNLEGVRYGFTDEQDRLWVATRKGLFLYNLKNDNSRLVAEKIAQQFVNQRMIEIYAMGQDKYGFVWAGTKESGIYSLKFQHDSIAIINKYTRENGLTNNKIKCISPIDDTGFYCSTITGLHYMVIDRSGTIKKMYNLSNITTNVFNITKKEGSTNLLLPNLNGLTIYTTGSLVKPTVDKRKLMLTQCTVNNQETGKLFTDDVMRFKNAENNVTFYFSPFLYNNNTYSYYYQLSKNGKESWQALNNSNYVQFNSLSHGTYTLSVKGIDNSNHEIFISKKFAIKPLWFQNNAFITAVIIALLILVFVLSKLKIKQVRKEAALKQLITETEIAALKAQMNPHFIFNCINSIDAFIHSNDKYNATFYLNKFAKLLRNILDSSKQNTVAFTKDIETLKMYIELEELRHENKFKTSISIEDKLLTNDYKVPPLIIQPFVENAILHGLKNTDGNEGLLQIEVKKLTDKIEYTIKDNGIGRKAAGLIAQNKESSYGMQLSIDRIRLFNREENPSVLITDLYNDDIPAGTEVKVSLNII